MPFEDFEVSVEQGRPVELYQFGYQGGTFRYTSDSQDFDLSGQLFANTPGLSRSAIDDTGEISKSNLVITAPEDFEVAQLFEVYPPSDVVDLTVFRLQRSDPTDVKTLWIGRVLNVTWATGVSTLSCESMFTRLKQPGLRRIFSKNCPHLLYGSECKASQIAFAESITVEAILEGGFQLVSSQFATFPDPFFSGGKVTFEPGGGLIHRRGIREHAGAIVTLTHPITGLVATDEITAFPGCDRTMQTCIDKFVNLENYGGFPYIPQKNPFGQNSIF